MDQQRNAAAAGGESDFGALFEESMRAVRPGEIVRGHVVHVSRDFVTVDIGFKSEGQIPIQEFLDRNGNVDVKADDDIDVFFDGTDTEHGGALLSRAKAEQLKVWREIEEAFEREGVVEGTITGKVKGGLKVDVGVQAFLPGSHADLRPVRNLDRFIGQRMRFAVLKFNRARGNVVVSRRAVLERERESLKEETMKVLEEGVILEGIVKNITEYGAFVDLGGLDGLLHVTDMSWGRVARPSDVIQVGERVKVVVLKYDPERGRVSLGMKQILPDPWASVGERFPVGARMRGKVVSLADYGAFVELEPGIEGLIHVSEMSWTKKNVHPGKIVSTSQEVEVQILEVDPVKRRISLGLKQTMRNPWEVFVEKYPPGTTVEGEVKNKTEFGLFLGLDGDVDGMVHLSDLDWKRPGEQVIEEYKKGDMVKAQVLDVDVEKERISLGIKQLAGDPMESAGDLKKGSVVTCEVTEVKEAGIEVKIVGTDLTAFIRRADLARERGEQRPERFAAGQKVDARVTQFDRKTHKVGVSIKALEVAEEKEAIAQYGTADSGASLGDILGAALKQRDDKVDDKPETEKAEE